MTLSKSNVVKKIPWSGVLISVQPRIRLNRSFDQRSHTYLGYALRVRGNVGSEAREFLIGVGESAHAKHQFRAGDTVSGEALPVADPRLETVEFYKVSNLKASACGAAQETPPPPWRSVPPPLPVYRERGHRRLAVRTYEEKCPRSRPLYRSGPARTVPGRRGMSYTEEDWIDDEATSHRGLDE